MSEPTCVHQHEFCKCVVAKRVNALVDGRDEAWARLVTASSREVWARDHGGALDWDAAEAERLTAVQALRRLGVTIAAESFTAD